MSRSQLNRRAPARLDAELSQAIAIVRRAGGKIIWEAGLAHADVRLADVQWVNVTNGALVRRALTEAAFRYGVGRCKRYSEAEVIPVGAFAGLTVTHLTQLRGVGARTAACARELLKPYGVELLDVGWQWGWRQAEIDQGAALFHRHGGLSYEPTHDASAQRVVSRQRVFLRWLAAEDYQTHKPTWHDDYRTTLPEELRRQLREDHVLVGGRSGVRKAKREVGA